MALELVNHVIRNVNHVIRNVNHVIRNVNLFLVLFIDFPWMSDSVLLYPESVFLWTVSLDGGVTVQPNCPRGSLLHNYTGVDPK